MGIISVAVNYILWHYSTAYVDGARVWWNYMWFVNHLFAVPEVLKSWFAPFKRMQEAKANILLHPDDFFANLFVNLIMRLVGFLLRTTIITLALLCFTIVLVGGALFIVLWTLLPFLTAYYLITSMLLLLS